MISEERFNRMEDKLDKTSDKVIGLESEFKNMARKYEDHIELVQEHIAGDQKIIDQLEDLVPQLKEMTQDHLIRKSIREEKKKKRELFTSYVTDISKVLGIVSVVAGTIYTILKITQTIN